MKTLLDFFPYVRELHAKYDDAHRRLASANWQVKQLSKAWEALNDEHTRLREQMTGDKSRHSLIQGFTNQEAFNLGLKQGVKTVVERIGPWTQVTLPGGRTFEREDPDHRIEIDGQNLRVYSVYTGSDTDEEALSDVITLCQNLRTLGHEKVADQLYDVATLGCMECDATPITAVDVRREELTATIPLEQCVFEALISVPAGAVK